MFLEQIRIERFGTSSDQQIVGLTRDLNVFYFNGSDTSRIPFHFLRSMFFGFDSPSCRDYLSAESKGFGGSISVSTTSGSQMISRYDDGSANGRLTIEHANESPIGRRNLHDLLGGITAGTFDHLFAIDLADRPSVSNLLSQAQVLGLDLTRQSGTDHATELKSRLETKRRQLETRRDQLVKKTRSLEQGPLQSAHRRLIAERDECITARDLMSPTRSDPSPETRQQLAALDSQLDRWRAVLEDISAHQESPQLAASRGDSISTSETTIGTHLLDLKRQIEQLRVTYHESGWRHDTPAQQGESIAAQLSRMQDRVYRICRCLSETERTTQDAESTGERLQLARCEAELQVVVRRLVARRQQLDSHASQNGEDDWYDRRLVEINAELRQMEDRQESETERATAQLESHRIELGQVERELESAGRQYETDAENVRLEIELDQNRTTANDAILDDANTLLKRLSGGDYGQLDISNQEVFVVNEYGRRVSWFQLDNGGQDQVYLSLSLALVAGLYRRGTKLPVMLAGALTNTPSRHVAEAAEALRDYAARGIQVFLFTCYDHVRDVFEQFDVPIQVWDSPTMPRLYAACTNQDDEITVKDSGFLLTAKSRIDEALSVDESQASHLRKIGVWNAGDLLDLDVDEAASRLHEVGISAEQLHLWQAQTGLVCRIPHLRPYDARILVACGITDPQRLQQLSVGEVREMVQRLSTSRHGQSVLMSGTEYELSRVTQWMHSRRHSGRDGKGTVGPASRHDTRGQRTSHQASHRRQRATSTSESTGPQPEENVVQMDRSSTSDEIRWRFYLDANDPVAGAPSIGPRMAERLKDVGVHTVTELLNADADDLADRMKHRRTSADTIRQWQNQTTLVCRIPQLRGHDARILVALGITTPEELARKNVDALWEEVSPFAKTSEGKRIIRSGKAPDRDEVFDWISWARAARSLKAA